MSCLSKIILKIKNYINRFKVLRMKVNLLIIFTLYSVLFLITLLLYGYFNLINFTTYNKNNEYIAISQELRHIAANIGTTEDVRVAEKDILNTELSNKGFFILFDHNQNIIFSTCSNGEQLVDLEKENLLKNVSHSFGVLEGYNLGRNNKYIFYEKIEKLDMILLYIVSEKLFERYNFPALNFILFSSIVCFIVCFFIILKFKKKIYHPIVNIEKVIHGLVEGDTDFGINNIEKNNPLYSLYSDLNIMTDRLKNLILREYNANMMKKQAELDALQSQINPHFLYNTLESIRGQAITEGIKDIEVMTKTLSDLFRYSISNKGNMVTLQEELKNIDNYLLIQQYRFNNKFIIVNKVEPDTLSYKIPKFLIQPIVENAIHHGLETKIGKGTIVIKAYKTTKRMVVNVQDDGFGISHDKLMEINEILVNGQSSIQTNNSSLKIGLINVNERIKLNFGDDYGLKVYSAKGVGTNVEIVLPLLNE